MLTKKQNSSLFEWTEKSSSQLVRKLQGLFVAISKEDEEGGRRRRKSRPMRSQRRGRGRFGMRGRRREERRAKVEVWSSGDGREEREAGRALGCLGFWSAMLLHSVCEWLLHTLRWEAEAVMRKAGWCRGPTTWYRSWALYDCTYEVLVRCKLRAGGWLLRESREMMMGMKGRKKLFYGGARQGS